MVRIIQRDMKNLILIVNHCMILTQNEIIIQKN